MQDVFLIISVIDSNNKPLSYSNIRSIYSKKERLLQTQGTILSIKKYSPTSQIFIFEAGKTNYENHFKDLANGYFYLGNNPIIKLCINSKFKGLGEIAIVYKAIHVIKNIKNINDYRLFFKISGRYMLNANFNIENWNSNTYNFLEKEKSYSTRLYALPLSKLLKFKILLIVSIPFLLIGVSIEKILHTLISKDKVNSIKTLGVSGLVAVDGVIIKE